MYPELADTILSIAYSSRDAMYISTFQGDSGGPLWVEWDHRATLIGKYHIFSILQELANIMYYVVLLQGAPKLTFPFSPSQIYVHGIHFTFQSLYRACVENVHSFISFGLFRNYIQRQIMWSLQQVKIKI